jgi:hypothetical protein
MLMSHFRDAENLVPDKDVHQLSVNPLSKRLFLGHIIGRASESCTDTANGSDQSCPRELNLLSLPP